MQNIVKTQILLIISDIIEPLFLSISCLLDYDSLPISILIMLRIMLFSYFLKCWKLRIIYCRCRRLVIKGESLVLGVFAKFPLNCVRFSLFKVSSSCFLRSIQLSTHLCNTILHVYIDDICI